MNRKKRSAQALLLAVVFFASFLVPSGTAGGAASDYDDTYRTAPAIALSNDGWSPFYTECALEDYTTSWISVLRSAPQMTAPYVNSLNEALENGRWGVSGVVTTAYGHTVEGFIVYWTEDASLRLDWSEAYGGHIVSASGGLSFRSVLVRNHNAQTAGADCSPHAILGGASLVSTSSVQGGPDKAWNLFVYTDHPNYPSGYEGASVRTQPPAVKYVGLGDSYSSGLGSRRPYMAGTDTGTNKCRRSLVAYPRLLAADTSLNLGPVSFVACGGATASAVTTGGFNGESAQMDALTSETRLVSITITGNDMPFDVFARECATPGLDQGCVLTGQAYLNAIAGIEANVKPRLEQLLQTLDGRLAVLGSDARVLVIGYPHLLPASWVYETGCWWLQPDEHPAIRSVTDALNAAISEKVVAKGGRFEFVSATDITSPFIGHELCREVSTSSNYFNGVVSGENEADSFHPNETGQREGYARLVKDYLILHPLS